MHILSLQPYFGGSHQAFQQQWQIHSKHRWTILTLPPRHWKWRMRHAAVYFTEQLAESFADEKFDLLFCSDFLNLAELKGLAGTAFRSLPSIVYFHENQFAYPSRRHDERDLHFGFTNFTSCLAADQIWFNSAFNRDSFFEGLETACRKWPDYQPRLAIQSLQSKCRIESPGISVPGDLGELSNESISETEPVSLVWAARWEHDKNPELLLGALKEMRKREINFRVSVIGESFRRVPEAFEKIREQFPAQIDRWGFQTSEDYWQTLHESDIFLSTADHEFFGISAAEAIACGAFPVLPGRLAYPELVRAAENPNRRELFLYDGTPEGISQKVEYFVRQKTTETVQGPRKSLQMELRKELKWQTRAPLMDHQIDEICDTCSPIG